MAHIALPDGLPGITAGFGFRPEVEGPMRLLADVLLRGPSTLTPTERELIGVVVSSRNDCAFCRDSHRAAAAHCAGGDYDLVDAVQRDHRTAPISAKMRALLDIAVEVQLGGRHVTPAHIERARAEGRPTGNSTTRSSSPRCSACSIGTSTAWRHGRRPVTPLPMTRWAAGWRAAATAGPPPRGSRHPSPPRCQMPHIELAHDLPGIRGLMAFRPDAAAPLNALVECLLRGPHSLPPGERELIAAYVSGRNECRYCQSIHGAVAAHHLSGDEALVDAVVADPAQATISEKLKTLLAIAGKTAEGGLHVTAADVERARVHGASDLEIHDTVLIAAAFCLFNRYVDGLATWAPGDRPFYRDRAAIVVRHGYAASAVTPSPESQG